MAETTRATGSGADARMREAKRPINLAAGPYGHPFHPLLVTVPIGAWTASIVFDLGSRLADEGEALARGAWWLIALGVVGAVVAAIFGFMDFMGIPRRTRAATVALTHMVVNVVVLATFAVSLVWRSDRGVDMATADRQILLSVVALALLAFSGWLGGMLAYRYGVRVADEATQVEGFESPVDAPADEREGRDRAE